MSRHRPSPARKRTAAAAESPPVAAGARSAFVLILAFAVVGTALAVCPALVDSFRFRNPKALILGLAGAAGAVALARRTAARWSLTVVDVALLAYLGAGILSSLLYGRVWTRGASWASQELAALLLLWTASRAVTEDARRHPLLLNLVAASASIVAALVALEAMGVTLVEAAARPVATIGNRNWVGMYLAIGFAVVVIRELFRTAQWGLAQVVVIGAALLMTRSRGAWLGVLVVAAVAIVLVTLRRLRRARPVGFARRGVIGTAVAVAAAIALVAAVPWPGLRWTESSPYASSLSRLADHETGTGRLRADQMRVAIAVVAAHPILGVGPLQWHDAHDELAHAVPDHHADGVYGSPVPPSFVLRIAVETGLVGLLAFVIAATALARQARRRLAAARPQPEAVLATVAALLVAAVNGLFEAPFYNAETLALIAILAGTLRSDERPVLALPPAAARTALVLVGAFVLSIAAVRAYASPRAGASLETTRRHQRWFPLPEVVESIALSLTRDGRCADAAGELERTVRWSPHHYEPLFRAAICALQAGDREGGAALLRRVLALEPHRRAQVERLAAGFNLAL